MRKLLIAVSVLLFGHTLWAENAPPPRQPAILFAVPGENRYAWAGFDYLRELAKAGFAVDYVEGAQALTWERVQRYNVVVVLSLPSGDKEARDSYSFPAQDNGKLADYFGVLDRFRTAGGGVFLHYWPSTGMAAPPNDLLKAWGIHLPLVALKDSRIVRLSNLGREDQCAFTDRVAPSPVSEGVKQIWYPIFGPHFCSWHTMPIVVDANWQVVVRAGATAWTEIPHYPPIGTQPAADAPIPTEPIKDPVLFAIRDLGDHGRLAAIQTWYPFSIGSGMKWLYNNEILERGLEGQPSHYGRLLQNTYRWLAEPSLKSGALGGYVTEPARLLEPQQRPGAMDQFHEWYYKDNEVLEWHRPPSQGTLYRGLIGAQTALSGGQGTVAEYAAAAATAGLDFVVILEDFAQMTPAKLAQLKDAAQKASTPTLRILPGYRMKANTGNDLFVFGENPLWPDAGALSGAHHELLSLQGVDENGKWRRDNAMLAWMLKLGIESGAKNTLGYYNFTRSGASALQMYDLRAYSHAAIRTYEAGKLVEDMTDDYLTTCQSTTVPTPVSLNLVRSPQELREAVAQQQALTYAQARSLATLWDDALHWNGSYAGMNVFPSDGPLIHTWPKNVRVMTFGAEPFVTGRSLQIAPIHVSSEVGLKEIRIYDGAQLFRRFDCAGAKDFQQQLLFPAVVHRNLVLIAEDVTGGRAVSFALRQYKEGSRTPIFCADHINDCGGMLLAHGPHWPIFFWTPLVPDAGGTWDGGPVAMKAILNSQFTSPVMEMQSNVPEWSGGSPPYQVPFLEFADEGAVRCRMVCERRLPPAIVDLGVNPWSGYAPLEPTEIADAWASHTIYNQYTTGVDPHSYGAPGINEGPIPSLFTQHFTFKTNDVIKRFRLYHSGWRPPSLPASVQFAAGRGGQILENLDLSVPPETLRTCRIATGDWFAFYSALPSNPVLFINRGAPVVLHFTPGDYWVKMYADFENKAVKPGDTYDTEFFAISWPMNEKLSSARDVAQMVTYLENPTGLKLIQGTRGATTGGLFELNPSNYVVELAVPKSPQPVVVPLRANGFNKRWSVGLYQLDGYRTHYYSKANSGYRALGLDFDGRAHAPLYVSMAANTHVRLGHPIVADDAGKEIFIQVTRINDDGTWHVSVNNPTDKPITTTLRQAMELPGLNFGVTKVTLQPGEYKVLLLGTVGH